MKVAVMQPYFFPYLGYFQLIHAADLFVIYDNIQYTRKGWINRNRFLQNGTDVLFSIPLKKDSDYLNIDDREIAFDFKKDKLLNRLREAYRQAPCFKQSFPVVEQIILQEEYNLFRFLYHSVLEICTYLEIKTGIVVSSHLSVNHTLKGRDRVVAICRHMGASLYINAIGGMALYSRDEFKQYGIELRFLKTKPVEYRQYDNAFVPWLSIIDVMMFNSKDRIREYITDGYDLI